MRRRIWMITHLLVALAIRVAGACGDEPGASPAAALSPGPTALAWDSPYLLVAQRDGTLLTLHGTSGEIVRSQRLGTELSDLCLTDNSARLFVADAASGRALVCRRRAPGDWYVAGQISVPGRPVSIRASSDASRIAVAAMWARQVHVVDVVWTRDQPRFTTRKCLDLVFAPRRVWLSPDGALLMATDAFGDRLLVYDCAADRILGQWRLPGRNVRGIAASPDGERFHFPLQLVNERVPTERDQVFWGSVISNVLVTCERSDLLASPVISNADRSTHHASPQGTDRMHDFRPLPHWSLYPLGGTRHGGGDPNAILAASDGHCFIAIGGMNEVLDRPTPYRSPRRYPVGARPTALALDGDERRLFVANLLDNTITVIDRGRGLVAATWVLGAPPSTSEIARGERLFYDARLALDGWYSCHSCHTDGHSNGACHDNLGDGDYGAPKRILSLLGAAGTEPFGWTGRRAQLEDQIEQSILTTMHGGHDGAVSPSDVKALAAYVASLPPPPGVDRARGRCDANAIERGRQVFIRRGCSECHAPPSFTSPLLFDVGLRDERGRTSFNPPSLLGVSQRDGWFHDHRAQRLRDVFAVHGHPDAARWSDDELDDLLAWLRSL